MSSCLNIKIHINIVLLYCIIMTNISSSNYIPDFFFFFAGLTKHLLAEESMAADELFDSRLYFLTRSVTIPDVNFLLH